MSQNDKKTLVAVLLNFFIYGLGYIYLRKKVGLGILLLILDMILIGVSSANFYLVLKPYEVFFGLLISVYLSLDAYRLSTGHKIKFLNESSQKIVEKIGDTLLVLLVIVLLVDSMMLVLIPKGIESISSQQSDIKNGIVSRESNTQQKVIKIYIDKFPYGVDKKYENSIRESMSFWEKNANANFKEVLTFQEADVYVNWFKEFGTGTLGHTVNRKGIDIGLGDSSCLEKWKPYTYETVLLIAEHELGHALGADDNYENPNKIMYYKLTTKYETDIEEQDILPSDLARFYPLCTKNEVATYSFEVTSTEPLNIYIVPSKEDYEFLIKRQEFTHYSSCEGKSVKFYQKTCTVSKEGGIVLVNSLSNQKVSTQFKLIIKQK